MRPEARRRQIVGAARQHVIDHDIATVPADDHIRVIETPQFLRNVIPFAAYFDTLIETAEEKGWDVDYYMTALYFLYFPRFSSLRP